MYYSSIRQMDISNGQGIRVSLFVSGCQFHCKNCFNKEAQNYNYGTLYTNETEQYILNLVSKSHISGLSILGGDPLWQSGKDMLKLTSLSRKVRQELSKNVWIWSGFTYEQLFNISNADNNIAITNTRALLVKECDIFVDGKYEDDLRDLRLKWRGSSNQRVIDVQKSIAQNKIILYTN